MTREEAVAKIKDITAENLAEALVDGAAALGLLKLEEPKSVDDRAIDALTSTHPRYFNGFTMRGAIEVRDRLKDAGLQIVEKP